ncbi:MAG: DUF5716 family protein [Clostridium sp.]|jgi:hypothetical protein|nr:DUF5716 family protein [Clostridium sp.]
MALRTEKVYIGYDLGESYSQISYCFLPTAQSESEPETLPGAIGSDRFLIPTVLCKMPGENRWTFGQDALRCAGDGGILVDHLFESSLAGESTEIEDTPYDSIALLSLFVKRSLSLLQFAIPAVKISAILFTVRRLNDMQRQVLEQITQSLELKGCMYDYMEYQESYFYYLQKQPKELLLQECLLCDYLDETVYAYHMIGNDRTVPKVNFVEEETYESGDLLENLKSMVEGRVINTVYLIGEPYESDAMKEVLRYLCAGRRVFQGTNLFSKGACYALLARHANTPQNAVFLGREVVKANIGLRVKERGKLTYLALIDAGVPWREVGVERDIYLQDETQLPFMIAPVNGKTGRVAVLSIENKAPIRRISIRLYMTDASTLCIECKDLGFGEFEPSPGRIYREFIEL